MLKPHFGIIKTKGSFTFGFIWNNHEDRFILYFCLGLWMANIYWDKTQHDIQIPT